MYVFQTNKKLQIIIFASKRDLSRDEFILDNIEINCTWNIAKYRDYPKHSYHICPNW